MFPTIRTSSLIITKSQPSYEVGDIITFYAKINNKEEIITHRIYRLGGNLYLTKGDNNQAVDKDGVVGRLVIGKVIMIIPDLGYLINFTKSQIGVFVLIIFPTLLIIAIETFKIVSVLGYPKLK